jgi:hypothetical protein
MRPRRDAGYAGAAGRHIGGNALIAWVYFMASKVRVFALASLPLVNEPLPLLSHFGSERFEAGSLLTELPEGSAQRIADIFLSGALL